MTFNVTIQRYCSQVSVNSNDSVISKKEAARKHLHNMHERCIIMQVLFILCRKILYFLLKGVYDKTAKYDYENAM